MSKEPINKNDMILVDCGCDYGGYASDITRTWPISGCFNPTQKLLYEAVLDIQLKLIGSAQLLIKRLHLDLSPTL